MSKRETDAAFRKLQHKAIDELNELEQVRGHLEYFIHFVDEYARGPVKSPGNNGKRQSKTDRLTAFLKQHPGIRASMLAALVGDAPEHVTEELEIRAAAGAVRRDGLGWRLT
jgi:hypothetical protein